MAALRFIIFTLLIITIILLITAMATPGWTTSGYSIWAPVLYAYRGSSYITLNTTLAASKDTDCKPYEFPKTNPNSGKGTKTNCVFPFFYKGYQRDCITAGHTSGNLWCYTDCTFNNNQWKDCNSTFSVAIQTATTLISSRDNVRDKVRSVQAMMVLALLFTLTALAMNFTELFVYKCLRNRLLDTISIVCLVLAGIALLATLAIFGTYINSVSLLGYSYWITLAALCLTIPTLLLYLLATTEHKSSDRYGRR